METAHAAKSPRQADEAITPTIGLSNLLARRRSLSRQHHAITFISRLDREVFLENADERSHVRRAQVPTHP